LYLYPLSSTCPCRIVSNAYDFEFHSCQSAALWTSRTRRSRRHCVEITRLGWIEQLLNYGFAFFVMPKRTSKHFQRWDDFDLTFLFGRVFREVALIF